MFENNLIFHQQKILIMQENRLFFIFLNFLHDIFNVDVFVLVHLSQLLQSQI